jgi:CubicO group peptidase (beta-lactamase class C family)
VAGHAGFFSTAGDLEKYMQVHLRKGKLENGRQFYKP